MQKALIRWLLAVGLVVVTFGTLLMPEATSAAPTPCVDLQLTNITFSPATPIAGHPAAISITIYNSGGCTVYPAFTVQWKESATSPTGPSTQIPGGLGPYASTTVVLPYVFTRAGNYQSQVQVDTTNAVDETNEVNNLQIAPVTVLSATVKLVIKSFTVGPANYVPGTIPNPVAGRVSEAAITVYNQGNTAAGPFRVDWQTRPNGTTLSEQINGLGAGQTTTIYLDYTYLMPGTFASVASIGTTSATTLVTVDQALPDLLITNVGFNPNPPIADSVTSVDVTIANIGHANAGSFVVSWTPGALVAPLTQQVNSLAEGATTTVSFDYTFRRGIDYTSTFTVNSTNSVRELNGDNDTLTMQVPVSGATVDLTITSVTVVPSNGGYSPNLGQPTQGSPATFRVTVQNTGNTPAGSFVVSLNPDTTGLMVPAPSTLTTQVSGLGAGQTATLVFPFTYTAFGNFRVLADVDAFNQVVETNESNNELITYPEVNPAPIDLVITGFSVNPSNPTFLQKVTATITVQNNAPQGDPWIANTFWVQFKAKNTDSSGPVAKVDGLLPGQSTTVTLTGGPYYVGNQTFTAEAIVNVYNTVQEPCPGCASNDTATVTINTKWK